MQKTLFIDRDGTIIREPSDFQVDSLEKLSFLPFAVSTLRQLAAAGYTLVMVSNQDNLSTSQYPKKAFTQVQNKITEILKGEGVVFDKVFIDGHGPDDNHPDRKPGIGMLIPYLQQKQIDPHNSFVIGDRSTDALLAANLHIASITLKDKTSQDGDSQYNESGQNIKTMVFTNWPDIGDYILNSQRKATLERNTKETAITATVNLDGHGKADIDTGIGFFNHMLELFARHAGIDLTVKAAGDLHVDEHHTVEDTAIVLGQLFKKALNDKRGIERYSFLLPMDESLCQCAMDLSGRSGFYFQGSFSRSEINGFPTEMIKHFLKSFCDNAGINLHMEVKGENNHHQAEAVFKSLARCLKQAIARTPGSTSIPSSKEHL